MALHLLEMRRFRLEPDVTSYNTATSACEKGRNWEQAPSLLPEMLRFWLERDVISYNVAMSA